MSDTLGKFSYLHCICGGEILGIGHFANEPDEFSFTMYHYAAWDKPGIWQVIKHYIKRKKKGEIV